MSILNVVGAKVWGGGEQYVYDMCDELHRRDVYKRQAYIYSIYMQFMNFIIHLGSIVMQFCYICNNIVGLVN